MKFFEQIRSFLNSHPCNTNPLLQCVAHHFIEFANEKNIISSFPVIRRMCCMLYKGILHSIYIFFSRCRWTNNDDKDYNERSTFGFHVQFECNYVTAYFRWKQYQAERPRSIFFLEQKSHCNWWKASDCVFIYFTLSYSTIHVHQVYVKDFFFFLFHAAVIDILKWALGVWNCNRICKRQSTKREFRILYEWVWLLRCSDDIWYTSSGFNQKVGHVNVMSFSFNNISFFVSAVWS